MKLTILKWLLVATVYTFSVKAKGQTVVKIENGVYKTVTTTKTKKPATDTGKVYEDSKGNRYPIMKTDSAYFVLRTSAKTGKTYKQYLKL